MNTTQQTQVTFMSNTQLKDKAIKKAKKEGITLKALLTMVMKAYVNNSLHVSLEPNMNYYDDLFADKEIVAKSNQLGELLKKTDI